MEVSTSEGISGMDVGEAEIDDLFDVLRNRKRRFTLQRLRTSETAIVVSELAYEIVAWEERIPVEEVTPSHAERIRAGLYHNHLPKMAEVGLVEFDRDEQTVELADEQAVDSLVGFTRAIAGETTEQTDTE